MRFNFLRKLAAVIAEETLGVSEPTLRLGRQSVLEGHVWSGAFSPCCPGAGSLRGRCTHPWAICLPLSLLWAASGACLLCVSFSLRVCAQGAVGGEVASLSELSFCFVGQNVSWPRWLQGQVFCLFFFGWFFGKLCCRLLF